MYGAWRRLYEFLYFYFLTCVLGVVIALSRGHRCTGLTTKFNRLVCHTVRTPDTVYSQLACWWTISDMRGAGIPSPSPGSKFP